MKLSFSKMVILDSLWFWGKSRGEWEAVLLPWPGWGRRRGLSLPMALLRGFDGEGGVQSLGCMGFWRGRLVFPMPSCVEVLSRVMLGQEVSELCHSSRLG